jgi:hypothetical protein
MWAFAARANQQEVAPSTRHGGPHRSKAAHLIRLSRYLRDSPSSVIIAEDEGELDISVPSVSPEEDVGNPARILDCEAHRGSGQARD